MKKLLLCSAAVLVLMGGCPAELVPGRMNANDHLRSLCVGVSDAELETALSVVDAYREEGMSRAAALTAGIATCEADMDCLNCWTAIVDQVYGK